jgi:hypothetical protein
MNSNWNNDDWGWYIDTEKNTCSNFTVEYYDNLNPNKKMSYHLNRLETIEEEYTYYASNYEDNEKIIEKKNEIEKKSEIKNVENGYLFKVTLTTIIVTIFTCFTSFIFTLIN